MWLLIVLYFIHSSQAGLLLSELPITSAVTNSAISHQSIAQIHTNEQKVIHKSKLLLTHTPLHDTYKKESIDLSAGPNRTVVGSLPSNELDNVYATDHEAALKPSTLVLTQLPLYTYLKESTSPASIVFTSAHYALGSNDAGPVSEEGVKDKASSEDSPSPKVSYSSNNVPVFTSLTHTPAHLTFAASPVVHQLLSQILKQPFRSYEAFLTSRTFKSYEY